MSGYYMVTEEYATWQRAVATCDTRLGFDEWRAAQDAMIAPEREYSFTTSATFAASDRQQAWDMYVEWLTNPMNVEEGTQVVALPNAGDIRTVTITGPLPEDGWFCDHCSYYFDASLDACPTCGAFVDYVRGIAHRDHQPKGETPVGSVLMIDDDGVATVDGVPLEGTEGQDRESYTDTQDRDEYTVSDDTLDTSGEDDEQEYDVVIRNTFTATSPAEAVQMMVGWVFASANQAEYKVERYNEGESEPAQEWWISAS
jgi:hypothetical protein